MNETTKNSIIELLNSDDFSGAYLQSEPMSKHTSYKIGGNAEFLVECNNIQSLRRLMTVCRDNNVSWVVVGSGTNLLVSDNGFDGIVLRIWGDFKNFDYDQDNHSYLIGGACKLATIVTDAYKRGISGLEFAVGTPGSIGGAIRMNAGTSDCGISSCVKFVEVLHVDGTEEHIDGSDIEWGYRCCSLDPNDIVLRVCIAMKPLASESEIKNMQFSMDEKLRNRMRHQPQKVPTCGSVFKNPDGDSAGRLIEAVGLKGKIIGGARVSKIHANFIENFSSAKAEDIAQLIHLIQSEVYNRFEIKLTPEVKFLGFDQKVSIF